MQLPSKHYVLRTFRYIETLNRGFLLNDRDLKVCRGEDVIYDGELMMLKKVCACKKRVCVGRASRRSKCIH